MVLTNNILTGLIFVTAGFTQGVSGFGAALVAMPLLTLFMDVKAAVPLYMLHGISITGFLCFQLRDHIEWQKIRPLLIGSLPGIILGLYVLKCFRSTLLQLSMGGLIFSYAIYSLCFKPRPKSISPLWGYGAGFFTGAISSAFSAGGPPAIIYVSLTGWAKDEIKATLSGFFFITGLLTVFGHFASGLSSLATLKLFAITVPFTMVGVLAGSIYYRRIARDSYLRIMLWILMLLGILMGYSAARHP